MMRLKRSPRGLAALLTLTLAWPPVAWAAPHPRASALRQVGLEETGDSKTELAGAVGVPPSVMRARNGGALPGGVFTPRTGLEEETVVVYARAAIRPEKLEQELYARDAVYKLSVRALDTYFQFERLPFLEYLASDDPIDLAQWQQGGGIAFTYRGETKKINVMEGKDAIALFERIARRQLDLNEVLQNLTALWSQHIGVGPEALEKVRELNAIAVQARRRAIRVPGPVIRAFLSQGLEPYQSWMDSGVRVQITATDLGGTSTTRTGRITSFTNGPYHPILWLDDGHEGIYISRITSATPGLEVIAASDFGRLAAQVEGAIPDGAVAAVVVDPRQAIPVYRSEAIAGEVQQMLAGRPADFPVTFEPQVLTEVTAIPSAVIAAYDTGRGEIIRPVVPAVHHVAVVDLAEVVGFADFIQHALAAWTGQPVGTYAVRMLKDGRVALFV